MDSGANNVAVGSSPPEKFGAEGLAVRQPTVYIAGNFQVSTNAPDILKIKTRIIADKLFNTL